MIFNINKLKQIYIDDVIAIVSKYTGDLVEAKDLVNRFLPIMEKSWGYEIPDADFASKIIELSELERNGYELNDNPLPFPWEQVKPDLKPRSTKHGTYSLRSTNGATMFEVRDHKGNVIGRMITQGDIQTISKVDRPVENINEPKRIRRSIYAK